MPIVPPPLSHIPAELPQGPGPALPPTRDSQTFMDTIKTLCSQGWLVGVFLPASVPAACPGVG